MYIGNGQFVCRSSFFLCSHSQFGDGFLRRRRILLLLFGVLAMLAASATARPGVPFHPCNTVFIAYTISTSDAALPGSHRVSGSVSVYRVLAPIRTFNADPHPAMIPRAGIILPRRDFVPAEATLYGFSSLRDRAKDILVVVIGLLFGIGCGFLAAAGMYLTWLLVTYRHEICGLDAFSDEDDVDESPKKAGYVKIPAAEQISVKEGYEGTRVSPS